MSGGPSSTSTTSDPQWLENAGKDIYAKANAFYTAGYTPPPTDRVAPLNAQQDAALKGFTGAGSVPTAADVSKWMNPYIGATLKPTIQNINDQRSNQVSQLADAAHGANAFGDARQGVLEGQVDKQADTAIGGATAGAYDTGYTNAEAQAQNVFNDKNTALQDQLSAGNVTQKNAQSKLDVGYQNWQTQQQDSYDRLTELMSVITGVPASKTTSTSTNNQSSLLALLGALFGGSGAGAGA